MVAADTYILELTPDQIAYYRQVLASHGLDDNGLCRLCQVLRCPDWVDAYDKLAAAKQLMAKSAEGNGDYGGRDNIRTADQPSPRANAPLDRVSRGLAGAPAAQSGPVSGASALRPALRTPPAIQTSPSYPSSQTSHASQILQSIHQAPRGRRSRSTTKRWSM